MAEKSFDANSIYLEAQKYAIGYYEKEGFKVVSDEFLEDGIPHVQMERRLRTEDGTRLLYLNELSEDEIQAARDSKDAEIAEKSFGTGQPIWAGPVSFQSRRVCCDRRLIIDENR